MIEVLPAIIPESYENLTCKMSAVKGIAKLVQIDVCDGRFVPSKSWPYVGDYENHFETITEESEGFPFWDSMDFEVDLMIKNPEDSVEKWIKAGAKGIVLHIESSPKILDLVKDVRKTYGYYGDSLVNVEIGIALNIDTPNEVLYDFLKPNTQGKTLADFVQFMGIKKVGYQGQEFDQGVLPRIIRLREAYPELIISIDGGVTLANAVQLVDAGVNRLVSGSEIFDSVNVVDTINRFKSID